MPEELKPCPFCASTNVRQSLHLKWDKFNNCERYFYIHCLHCGCGTGYFPETEPNRPEIEAWNRRKGGSL